MASEPTYLTFVTNEAHCASLAEPWTRAVARRVVVCLDEGFFSPDQAVAAFRGNVQAIGLSDLELPARAIMEEGLRLARDLFPPDDASWPARSRQSPRR